MDYINAFWVGGLICALVQILLEKDKADAGKSHGDFGLRRGLYWVQSIFTDHFRSLRGGSQCTAAGIWQYAVEGRKKGHRDGRFHWNLYGGFTASAVGISAALVFSYLASLIFKPKMKE